MTDASGKCTTLQACFWEASPRKKGKNPQNRSRRICRQRLWKHVDTPDCQKVWDARLKQTKSIFRRILQEKGIENVRVIQTGCFGLCAKGPIVIIRPEDVFYAMVKPEDCEEIVEKHIQNGELVQRLLCKDIDGKVVERLDELTFYKKQKRISYFSRSTLSFL